MRVDTLPAVLTSFAYREEYFPEMEGMLETVREHHPDWAIVIGRGPVAGFELPTFEVESPTEKRHWTLPLQIKIENNQNDFYRIAMMKGWWLCQVWREFAHLAHGDIRRIVWSDADNRFNGPLDIELDPLAEVVAGPWWNDPLNRGFDTICSGILLFQGVGGGATERIVDQWSTKCLGNIESLPPQTKPWIDSDQEGLTEVLRANPDSNGDYTLLKLEMKKYVDCPADDDKLRERGLVDHWNMSAKMMLPEFRSRNWPPPEEYRRRAEVGTPVPNINWDPDD